MGRQRYPAPTVDSCDTADAASVWQPEVLQVSAITGEGLPEFWEAASRFRTVQASNGGFEHRRRTQDEAWMWERIEAGLAERFRRHPAVRALLPSLTTQVREGAVAASAAARRLLDAFH